MRYGGYLATEGGGIIAVAGDSHAIPSRPIKLVSGRVVSYNFTTNKPRELVERDCEQAALRLLRGERFEVHCSELQISRVQMIVDTLIRESKADGLE